MGDVFKQAYTKPDPAEPGRRVRRLSAKWYGEYLDHDGRRRRVALAADKVAARSMLAELVRRAERRRAGILDDATDAAGEPLDALVAGYLADLTLRGRSPRYVAEAGRLVAGVAAACGWETPGDLRAAALDGYLARMDASARTRQKHRQAAVGFANWLARKGKLAANPLERSTRPEGERTYRRRALSLDELRRLVAAARTRPLDEERMVRHGPRAGAAERKLSPEFVAELERRGRHNALLYKVAYLTGLRAEELRSLLPGDFVLDGPNPRVHLPGERTKSGKDARLPIPAHLAADVRAWIAEQGLGDRDRLFAVPHRTAELIRADLRAAGIDPKDARGRVADFHSLRGSLATHLNAAGVAVTTAKALMRHSTITLTADLYHDEAMNEERRAVESLPEV